MNIREELTANHRRRKTGICLTCGSNKSQFIKTNQGRGLINSAINKLPFEMHLPGHNFTGPGTNLKKRLDEHLNPKAWSQPVNRVDQAAYHHDVCYLKNKDTATRNDVCDKNMLTELEHIKQPTLRERMDRGLVKQIIGAKVKFGLGLKKKA